MAHRLVLSLGGALLVGVAHGTWTAAQAPGVSGGVLASAAQATAAEPVSARAGALATNEPTGPTVAALSAAARAPVVTRNATASVAVRPVSVPVADEHLGAGRNVALMVVGAAGLITGLIIGKAAGTAIAIGGAAVGLYGLYQFLQ